MRELSSALRDLIERSVSEVDVGAIIAARRRRRRHRRLGAAMAVVVIAAVVTGGVLARPVREPKVSVLPQNKISEADATRAALADLTIIWAGVGSSTLVGGPPGDINLTDPVSGATHAVPFPIPSVRGSDHSFVVQGSSIVMVLDAQKGPYDASIGTAYVASSDFRQWQGIGPASYAFAARDPDRVWLLTDNATPDQRLHGVEYGSSRTVVEVGIDGSNRSPSYPLTDRRSPVAAVAGGLLTSRPAPASSGPPVYEVWDAATDRVVRRLEIGGAEVAASSTYIAWTARDCPPLGSCALHVTDVATGAVRLVAPPRGLQWSPSVAFSPDGRSLALVAYRPPTRKEIEGFGVVVPPGTRNAVVAIIDATTGKETTRSTTTWKGSPNPSWSPDGSLVFFVRDRTHLGYFNTTYATSEVRELAVSGADVYLVAVKPTPSTATQRYEYDGLVAQTAHHSPELCIYPTTLELGPSSDSCAGPLVVGWNASKTSGRFHLVGTYDGHEFTLSQPPSAPVPLPPTVPKGPTPPVQIPSGCPTPPGGWQVTNAARISFDDYNAVTNAARAAPGFAGMWFGPTASVGGSTDYAHSVINIAFTGNLDAHRRALADIWGGPICVVQRPHSYAELQTISRALFGAAGRQLGLQMIAGGPDDVLDVVHAEVVAATAETRRAVDQRFGKGVVDLTSVLRPVR
jgi:hypothetical protein